VYSARGEMKLTLPIKLSLIPSTVTATGSLMRIEAIIPSGRKLRTFTPAGGNPFAAPVQGIIYNRCFRSFAALLGKLPLRPCQNRFKSPDICLRSGNLVATRPETCRLKLGADPGNKLQLLVPDRPG